MVFLYCPFVLFRNDWSFAFLFKSGWEISYVNDSGENRGQPQGTIDVFGSGNLCVQYLALLLLSVFSATTSPLQTALLCRPGSSLEWYTSLLGTDIDVWPWTGWNVHLQKLSKWKNRKNVWTKRSRWWWGFACAAATAVFTKWWEQAWEF